MMMERLLCTVPASEFFVGANSTNAEQYVRIYIFFEYGFFRLKLSTKRISHAFVYIRLATDKLLITVYTEQKSYNCRQ